MEVQIEVLGSGHEPSGMDEVEDADGQDHHGPVERDEVSLVGDQKAGPTLQQLDGTVDASNVNAHDGEDHDEEQRHHGAAHLVQQVLPPHAAEEVGRAEGEDGDGGHLEDDPGDHHVGAGFRVAVDRVARPRRHAAADGLHDERDDVAGAEDPQVQRRAQNGRFPSENGDESAQQDVDAGREERRCCLTMTRLGHALAWFLLRRDRKPYR